MLGAERQLPDRGQRGEARDPDCDIGAFELQFTFDSFCDASDGSLSSCPCANAGTPDAGCDNAQGTGGVRAEITTFDPAALSGTLTAGFDFMPGDRGANACVVEEARTV